MFSFLEQTSTGHIQTIVVVENQFKILYQNRGVFVYLRVYDTIYF